MFDGIDDVDVEAVTAAFGTVEVVARGRAAWVECPDCDCFSDRVHDRHQRRLKDLPLAEQGFVIRLSCEVSRTQPRRDRRNPSRCGCLDRAGRDALIPGKTWSRFSFIK
ncbi:hypothetical protein ACFVFI_03940 [Streptomyces sp. NPDC057705]|uniref:hypothetical protein n=1 Tax=Streptomyces sp. NPDC057705 TaxID=3346222 RepID=UPI00368C61EC